MRSFRLLVAGAALLALAALSTAIALHSGGNPETAIAVAATPAAWDVEWNVDVLDQPIAGDTVHVGAEAILTSDFGAGPLHDPIYNLAITGSDPALELMSVADVLPEDVSDGAEWELRALRRGEATIDISLTYKQSWCYPCNTHFITETTTRQVTVLPLPGDVDCDVAANSIDAALILQLAAALIGELPCQDVADVSQDGRVDALDATLILQYAAGLLESLAP